jgi:putative addiction module component (TIGR02574 family)
MADPARNIDDMSADERQRLLEQLWGSLRKVDHAFPLTNTQREELDRRLDELEQDGGGGIPWDEVLQRIQGQR